LETHDCDAKRTTEAVRFDNAQLLNERKHLYKSVAISARNGRAQHDLRPPGQTQ